MIQIQQLSFRYAKDKPWILNGLNLEIPRGEFTVLLGPNGSGKSTLADLLAGLLVPTSGHVKVDGLDSRHNPAHLTGKVGLVFQNPEHQFFHDTVSADVAFGPENLGLSSAQVKHRVERVLKEVGIEELAEHSPQQLSGGQKQLVAIAGILAMEPEYLILDEPTAMLDPPSKRRIRNVVKNLHASRGCAVLWITQDMEEMRGATRALVLSEGRIALEGFPDKLMEKPEVLAALGLDPPLSMELERMLKRQGMEEAAHFVRRRSMELLGLGA
ncbi:MAG: ATP-binding cassette domain-containing protein [bacterium]